MGGAPAPPVCQPAIRRRRGWRSGFPRQLAGLRLVVPSVGSDLLHVVELFSQTIAGLPDEVGDLSFDIHCMRCRSRAPRGLAVGTERGDGRICAMKLGGLDLPFAESVFRGGDPAV